MPFTTDSNRNILLNGLEWLSVQPYGNTPAVEADNAARQIAELLNAFGTSSPTVCDYSNYETFHIAMYLNGNSSSAEFYGMFRRLAKKSLGEEMPALWLADKFEQIVSEAVLGMDHREENCNGPADILAHSLLSAAFDRVNWRELAEEWLDTAREEAA